MATIINTPPQNDHHNDEGMGLGMILGIILAILVGIIVFYVYGWPIIRGDRTPEPESTNINITIPESTTPAPEAE